MAKVVFVQPRAEFDFYGKYKMPLLGSFYLGEIVRRRGHQVRVICESVEPAVEGGALNPALVEADFVGITTITSTANRAYEIADVVRKGNPGARIVIGGSHATFRVEEALEHCDIVVSGEGENVIVELVEGTPSSRVIDGGLVRDLDTIPFPDFEMSRPLLKYMRYLPIATSRGCPYNCNFCAVTLMFGKRFRFRSPANVIEELKLRVRQGFRRFFFTDDNFGASRERAKEIAEGIIREKLPIIWSTQARHDIAHDDELLKLMKRANCYYVLVGLESINTESLKLLNKRQTSEDVLYCIKKLQEHDINIHGMFVLGSDADDAQTGVATSKLCRKMGIHSIQYAIMIPLPGTPLYSKLDEEQRIMTHDWSLYDGTHAVFRPLKIAAFELQRMWETAYKKFYTPKLFLGYLYCRRFLKKWRKTNKDFIRWLKQIDTRWMRGLSPA